MNFSCNDYEKHMFDALDAYKYGHLLFLSAAAIAYQIKPYCQGRSTVGSWDQHVRDGARRRLRTSEDVDRQRM